MIYGFLTTDPEDGVDCVIDLKDSLIEVLDKAINIASEGYVVKSNRFKSVEYVNSDTHLYYPEMEPFLWNTKLFKPVTRKEIKNVLKNLNEEDKTKYLIYLNN